MDKIESRLLDNLYDESVADIQENWPSSCPLSKQQLGYVESLIADTIAKTASILKEKGAIMLTASILGHFYRKLYRK